MYLSNNITLNREDLMPSHSNLPLDVVNLTHIKLNKQQIRQASMITIQDQTDFVVLKSRQSLLPLQQLNKEIGKILSLCIK